MANPTVKELMEKNADLQVRLEAAEEALRAIQSGEVDALVVYGKEGEQVYTLESADSTYRVMVEKIQEGVATLQPDGMLLYANQRLAEMLDVPLESLLGSTLLPFIPPQEKPIFSGLLRRGAEGAGKVEMTMRRRDGSTLPVLLSLNCVESQGERLICLVASDLTEQKRQEEILASERLAHSILDQAAEAIVVCDTHGMIIRTSQATYDLIPENPLFRPFPQVFSLMVAGNENPDRFFSLKEVLQGRSFRGIEVQVETPPCLSLLLSASPLRNEREEIIGCIVSLTDITKRKQAEEALKEKEEHLRLATQGAGVGTFTYNFETGESNWSPELKALWGIRPDQPGQLDDDLLYVGLHPDDRAMFLNAMTAANDPGGDNDGILEVDYRVVHPNGAIRWLRVRGRTEFTGEGENRRPARAAGATIDITDRKQFEQRIAAEKEWFRTTLASIGDAVITTDPEGNVTFLNPVAEQLTGWSVPEAFGLPMNQVFPLVNELTNQKADNPVERVLQEGKVVGLANHTALISRNGQLIPIEDSAAPIRDSAGQMLGVVMVFHDVTEKRKSEDKLQQLYRLIELSYEPIFTWDLEAGILTWNQGSEQLYGYSRQEAIGGNSHDLLQTRYPIPVETLHAQLLSEGMWTGELHQWTKDGRELLIESRHQLMELGGHGVVLETNRDITARKQAEKALQDSEERFRQLADAMPQLVWTARPDGAVDYFNKRHLEYDGLERQDDGTWQRVSALHPDDVQFSGEAWQQAVKTGEVYQVEIRVRKLDGGYRWHLNRAVPIHNDQGQIIKWYGTATDIDNQKQIEAQLAEFARKLKQSNQELEQFAFVASHDLQEPLRKIKLFGNSLLHALGESFPDGNMNEALDDLRRMQNAAERMQTMIDGLLELSRITTHGGNFAPVELRPIVEEVLSDLEARICTTGGQVVLEDLYSAEVDVIQIRRLFQNLIGNALKFHKPGVPPVIKISGSLARLPGSSSVTITIKDNGIGFDEQYTERIFQPFQRLHGRSEYEGTGLGLSIVQRIVERHHGKIEVHSRSGEGSVFQITLPVVQPAS